MKKKVFFSFLYLYYFSIGIYSFNLEYSAVLGFSGMYKENSWTPLLVRIRNRGPDLSGDLIVETTNSGTATDQTRQYIKTVDLSSDSVKILSFVIPLGHHNREIKYYFQSQNSHIFENIINLKQKGIKKNFLLGVSPYPDLQFLSEHNEMKERIIAYPHIDNLPGNSMAYNSVDIISMHREFMDRLSLAQFQAISGWVSKGGILVVWGGKSPSPSSWDYLPSKITGLKKIDSLNSQVLNIVETPSRNRLLAEKGFDLLSYRESGSGYVYFATFDYRVSELNDKWLSTVWQIIFQSPENKIFLQNTMNNDFSVKEYMAIFNDSSFNHLDKTNVMLILFLTSSASVSIMLFVRFKRDSKNVIVYITGMLGYLIILSLIIFVSLFSKNFRTDSSIISINVLYHTGKQGDATLFKDILIGTTNKSSSDIMIRDDSQSVILQENYENLKIRNTPEIHIENLKMNQWSSKILKLESTVESIIDLRILGDRENYSIEINNQSDLFLRSSFIFYRGEVHRLGNIMPRYTMKIAMDKILLPNDPSENIGYNSNPLLNSITKRYLGPFTESDALVFCAYTNDEIHPLEFTNPTWVKKPVNLVLFQLELKEDNFEKSSF